jgi:glycosyltransferase involved in cell wall biosynthesis
MSDLPLVSIVTPSYNQAQFLEQTIRSVLEQDYPRIEYMIVDGGSTDGSVDIIKKYADRLAWWVSEKDSGQAEAINKGLLRAHGELIAWLNSDDVYLPGAVSAAVRAFEQKPQTGLVYGNVLAVDERGRPLNLLRYGDRGVTGLMEFRIIGQPSVFMRRQVLEQTGFLDPSYHFLLDHQLWLRMAQITGMDYLPKTLSEARFHRQSKNVARAAEFGEEIHRIVDWMRVQPDLTFLFSKNETRIRAGAARLEAFYLLDGGQPAASLRAYGRALRLHPLSAWKDWKRIALAVLSLFGLGRLGNLYRRLRRKNI